MCFRLKSCCFCNSLERGAKIIAILAMVFSILQLITSFARLYVASIISAMVNLIFSVLLFYGAKAGKPVCILAWLVYAAFQLIMSTALGFFFMVKAIKADYDWTQVQATFVQFNQLGSFNLEVSGNNPQLIFLITTIAIFLITALHCYFWMVVYSLYKEQKESKNETYQVDERKI